MSFDNFTGRGEQTVRIKGSDTHAQGSESEIKRGHRESML